MAAVVRTAHAARPSRHAREPGPSWAAGTTCSCPVAGWCSPKRVAARQQRRMAPRVAPRLTAGHRCGVLSRAAASADGRLADPVYMQEYQALKDDILSTARKAGGGLAAYLLFAVGGSAALAALAGSAASNLYLLWLFRDVDSITADTRVLLWEAEQAPAGLPRQAAKLAAAYVHALQPRLLVLVGLAAGVAAWNALSPADLALDLGHKGCLLAGFLSYKVPLIIKIADDNVPKNYKSDEMSRPMIERFEDELDQWGRPKKPLAPLPTEVLPQSVDTSAVPDLSNVSRVEDVARLLNLPLPGFLSRPSNPGGPGGNDPEGGNRKA